MLQQQDENLLKFLTENKYSFEENYFLSEISLHKLGGKIKYYVSVFNEKALVKLFEYICAENIEHFIVGEANGTIVSDNGYDGIAISLDGGFNHFNFEGDKLYAHSAITLHSLFHQSHINSLSGFEFLSSILCSLGAAIVYKIHAFGKNILDKMISVKILEINKYNTAVITEYSADEYNDKIFEKGKFVIISASFQLEEASIEKIEDNIDKCRYIRSSVIPEDISIGIVFEQKSYTINKEEVHTHQMIEKAGMLEVEYNGAKWYKRFPNYIMFDQRTKADDVYNLVKETMLRIKKYYNFDITLCIEFLGKF